MSKEIAFRPAVVGPWQRWQLACLVMVGQILGFLGASLLLGAIGLASQVVPVPRSQSAWLVMYALTAIPGPILCSWAFARPAAAAYGSPLLVSITSYLFGSGMLVWLVSLADGSRRSLGAMVPWIAVMVPLASIGGSFVGSYLQRSPASRAR